MFSESNSEIQNFSTNTLLHIHLKYIFRNMPHEKTHTQCNVRVALPLTGEQPFRLYVEQQITADQTSQPYLILVLVNLH
jgi:hypothetical protein